jgi:hypothetical protein
MIICQRFATLPLAKSQKRALDVEGLELLEGGPDRGVLQGLGGQFRVEPGEHVAQARG